MKHNRSKQVISDLDTQIRWIEDHECHQFPGWMNATMAMKAACALLEEQLAVEPKCYPETRYSGPVFACGDCHHQLETAKQKFCPFCGKPVKWKNEETDF